MAKQFTKVGKTYSTKNKLQRLILNELAKADGLLFANKTEAVNYIKQLYENALKEYKGNATVQLLNSFEANKNDTVFWVEDVIYISIYNVQTDLS